jgi:hypothetical protein
MCPTKIDLTVTNKWYYLYYAINLVEATCNSQQDYVAELMKTNAKKTRWIQFCNIKWKMLEKTIRNIIPYE